MSEAGPIAESESRFTLILNGRPSAAAKFSIEAVRKILHVVRSQANPDESTEQRFDPP
jgi:hypothetical protein